MASRIRCLLRGVYHTMILKPIYHIKLNYYWIRVSRRKKIIQNKSIIKVLFVVSEVASWKTEFLYLAMLKHPRFTPILGISTSYAPWGAKKSLINYLVTKGYDYIDLDSKAQVINEISPDLIFYYKPYSACYSPGHFFDKNLNYIFCGCDYGFAVTTHPVHLQHDLFDYCWQLYVENEELSLKRREVLGYRARNTRVTGIPMQDEMLQDKSLFKDPWKDQTGKKRIIYAPHHSIKGTNGDGIEFATFLDFGEPMLEFAKKYSDEITIAFKPHPNLYMKLINIWGQEKTDTYYNDWKNLPNTQLETGEYVGLFKYSDAIIHDCATFIVEYLYMNKPSMYLMAETNNTADLFGFVRAGVSCYTLGYNLDDIEMFIKELIEGKDNNEMKRVEYINKYLLPPGGKTACENIINAILGKE